MGDTKILLMALLKLIGIVKCQMSKVIEIVEWGFPKILAQWSLLDFRVAMKIFHSPVTKDYFLAALLVNT